MDYGINMSYVEFIQKKSAFLFFFFFAAWLVTQSNVGWEKNSSWWRSRTYHLGRESTVVCPAYSNPAIQHWLHGQGWVTPDPLSVEVSTLHQALSQASRKCLPLLKCPIASKVLQWKAAAPCSLLFPPQVTLNIFFFLSGNYLHRSS